MESLTEDRGRSAPRLGLLAAPADRWSVQSTLTHPSNGILARTAIRHVRTGLALIASDRCQRVADRPLPLPLGYGLTRATPHS